MRVVENGNDGFGSTCSSNSRRPCEIRPIETVVRKMVDEAFAGIGMTARVVAEIESASTLTAMIANGLGATVLPDSMARQVVALCNAWRRRIVEPVIEAPLALCQSDHLPLSEPAEAIKDILLELAADLPGRVLPAERKQAAS